MNIQRNHPLALHLYALAVFEYPFSIEQRRAYAKTVVGKDSPFSYLYDMEWDSHVSVMIILMHPDKSPLLKEIQKVRNGLKKMYLCEG